VRVSSESLGGQEVGLQLRLPKLKVVTLHDNPYPNACILPEPNKAKGEKIAMSKPHAN